MGAADQHVIPIYPTPDEPEHDTDDGTCWCQPVVSYEDPLTGNRVYTHRWAMDVLAEEAI